MRICSICRQSSTVGDALSEIQENLCAAVLFGSVDFLPLFVYNEADSINSMI